MFQLSEKSLNTLQGVHPKLVSVVKRAIQVTKVDFGVIEGLRSLERQKELFAAKKSQTMDSKHLKGQAVDLMVYFKGQPSWELNLYDEVADAMKIAAGELDAAIRWGAAWHIDDLRRWNGTMEAAMNDYIDLRRSQGKRPFIDGPHFEMS